MTSIPHTPRNKDGADSPAAPPSSSVDAVPISTFPFQRTWTATVSSYRNERKDCANPKPNEDRALIDPETGLIVVADGITRTLLPGGRYPDPSPSAMGAQVFCSAIKSHVRERPVRSLEDLAEAITSANRALREFNEKHFPSFDFVNRDRAGLAAVVGIVHGETLLLASIADCWCLGFEGGEPKRLAWEKTSHSRQEYVKLGEAAAREKLRNKLGNPSSYGAFTGEPEALSFVEYKAVSVEDMDRLVFSSDGLLRIAHENPAELRERSAGSIIRLGRAVDLAHEETDDKTIVLLDRRKPHF